MIARGLHQALRDGAPGAFYGCCNGNENLDPICLMYGVCQRFISELTGSMFDVGSWTFDVRLGIRQYSGSCGINHTRFPLTPALSLGEREDRRRICKQMNATLYRSFRLCEVCAVIFTVTLCT